MYNAFATADTEGSKGSTRLHMDMADAVNIMVYAEPCSDGAPGGAPFPCGGRPSDQEIPERSLQPGGRA